MERSRSGTVLAVLLIMGLVILLVWLAPQVLRRLNPVQQAAETLEEELDARLNPTPTIRPSVTTIIEQVQSLSRLETASYTIEKVITAESGQDALAFLFGDRLLFVAHGQVIAGVDLSRIGEGDITVTEDDRVVMVLPPAEVFVVTLDNERSFVYDRDTGLLGLNEQLETEARQAAEQEILDAALESGILETADQNARAVLQRLILAFGFREVIFVSPTTEAASPTPPPPTLPVTVVPVTP
jgi:hypothetical protein